MAENTSDFSDDKSKAVDFNWRAGWVDGAIALVTVLGNLLVFLLILTRPSLRKMENWFVVSLAVADFLVAAIPFPLRLVIGYLYYRSGTDVLIVNVTHDFFLWASTLNLCVLTLDRYLYIVHPMKYVYWRKKTNLVKITLVAWLVGFFIALTINLILYYVKNPEVVKSYMMFFLFFSTVLCLCLPTVYFHVLYIARRQIAQMNMQMRQVKHNYVLNENPAGRRQTSKRSKILVLGGVIGFFVLSNVINIVQLWLVLLLNAPMPSNTLQKTSKHLIYANSAINVFVYGLFKEDFRREMRKVFCRRTSGASDQHPPAADHHIELQ